MFKHSNIPGNLSSQWKKKYIQKKENNALSFFLIIDVAVKENWSWSIFSFMHNFVMNKLLVSSLIPYLKNGTIFLASFSAILNPWEYSITWAMSCLSGLVMAKLRNNFFKLSGRLDRPAYPGFMVMKTAISGFTLTCFPMSSTAMEPTSIKVEKFLITKNQYMYIQHNKFFLMLTAWIIRILWSHVWLNIIKWLQQKPRQFKD